MDFRNAARIMGIYVLNARIRRRRYPKNYYLTLKENSDTLPWNDLARNFKADGPFWKLVTDITYSPTTEVRPLKIPCFTRTWAGPAPTSPNVGFLKELGIHQGMSRKGNCWDNACIENFFGLMKSETISQTKQLLTVDEMIKLITFTGTTAGEFKKKLGCLSPVDFRKSAT